MYRDINRSRVRTQLSESKAERSRCSTAQVVGVGVTKKKKVDIENKEASYKMSMNLHCVSLGHCRRASDRRCIENRLD